MIFLILCFVCLEREKTQQLSVSVSSGCDASVAGRVTLKHGGDKTGKCLPVTFNTSTTETSDLGGYVPTVGRWGCEWPS